MSDLIPNNYMQIIAGLKEKIKQAKTKAALSVNYELLKVYWEIGTTILSQQKTEGWGTKIIKRLALDLRSAFPEMKGLSDRNLTYMQTFATAYPDFVITQQPAAQTKTNDNQEVIITQQAAAQLPWGHHQVILDKLKSLEERLFYIQKCAENSWSRAVLVHQIESNLHQRQGALTSNFEQTIPDYGSDLTQQLFKDPYNFDFLSLGEKARELDLENALITHITKVLLELGDGFAFMGRQYKLEAGDKEYFLDLLFYHTRLNRHVIIELKIGEFLPEYVGKMNFYLGLADDKLKGIKDEPAIGLILCKTKDKIVAEYALRDTTKPIGIAEYKINQLLPEDIKGELPSIEEIEQKLDEEIENTDSLLKEGLDKIKSLLSGLKSEEARLGLSKEVTRDVFNKIIEPIYTQTKGTLTETLLPYFQSMDIYIYTDGTGYAKIDDSSAHLKKQNDNCRRFQLDIRLKGLKKASDKAFDVNTRLMIELEDYKFTWSIGNTNDKYEARLYHQLLSVQELNDISTELCKILIDETAKRLEQILK